MQVRTLGCHRDFQSTQAVLTSHSKRLIVQNVVNEILHFGDVGCLKPGEEMVREKLCAPIFREKR
jgi:hypothetical protein